MCTASRVIQRFTVRRMPDRTWDEITSTVLLLCRLVLIVGCFHVNGCNGNNGEEKTEDETGESMSQEDVTTEPLFYGFNFPLFEGAYWTYQWAMEASIASPGGIERDADSGEFSVELGAPIDAGGVACYPLYVAGDSVDERGFDFAPPYAFMAIVDHCIYATADGQTWTVIFNAWTGTWQGGGFYRPFSDEYTLSASEGTLDNAFLQTPAIRVGYSVSQDFCDTVAGHTICPNDEAFTIREYEYYFPDLGPIGYYFYRGVAFSGSYPTSHVMEREAGLVDTNLID